MKSPRKSKVSTDTQEVNSAPPIRILKVGSCPSLSGKSTLTYHIGCDPQSEVLIRVHANSGGGYWSQEWVAFEAIQKTLPKDKPITSFTLRSLFKGKSTNSPGFLLAVLKTEGLVHPVDEKQRSYTRGEPDAFLAEVKALMASPVALQADDKPRKAEGKSKPAASTPRKTAPGTK